MKQKKSQKVIRILLLILVIAIFIGLIIYLIPLMKEISTKEGQLAFRQKINNWGILGMLVLFLLQLAQIILVVLPGEPLDISRNVLWNNWRHVFYIRISFHYNDFNISVS